MRVAMTHDSQLRACAWPARRLWRPGPPKPGADPKDDSNYVRAAAHLSARASRAERLLQSRAKMALLFGYFDAVADDTAGHMPGAWSLPVCRTTSSRTKRPMRCSTACTAAMSTRQQSGRPRIPRGFADIVALFQHFTYPDILRASDHADPRRNSTRRRTCSVSSPAQFGRTTGRRGALRDAIGRFDPATRTMGAASAGTRAS